MCVQLTLEEVMTTTAYLDLFLRSVSEPALLHTFLSFILLHTHDNVHILDTLVSRVNTPFQVERFLLQTVSACLLLYDSGGLSFVAVCVSWEQCRWLCSGL